jgi:hypothetical protein
MSRDLKKFFVKSLLLSPVFLALIVLPTAVLWRSGELTSGDAVVKEQAESTGVVLFGKAYNGKMGYYALRSVVLRSPEIVAMGSSRVMAFRSKFFKDDVNFYNAGGGASDIHHFREFLKRMPANPKVVIAGFDQIHFNADWMPGPEILDFKNLLDADAKPQSIWMSSFNKVAFDYLNGKFRLKEVFKPQSPDFRRIGLSAIAEDSGTLNDGSHYYGGYIRHPQADPDFGFKLTLGKIERGEGFFKPGNAVSQAALDELDAFLRECSRRGIYVIGFLPPFPHKIYAAMQSSSRYTYLDGLAERMRPIFERYGFDLFDFSDLASVGASDEETYDGYHGSEKAYLRMFLKMIENNAVLKTVTDQTYLKGRLEQSRNPYTVFAPEEF